MITYKLTMLDCDTNMKIAIKIYRDSSNKPVLFRRTINLRGEPCIEITLTDKDACIEVIKQGGFIGSLEIEDTFTIRTWIDRADESRISPAYTDSRSQCESLNDIPGKVTLGGLLELIDQNGVQKTVEDVAKGRYEIIIEEQEGFLLTAKDASGILECIASIQSAEVRCSLLKKMCIKKLG